MKKHLYEIKKLDIPSYLKWWLIKYRNAGTLSEVLENLTSPITLQNSLRRKFKIFEIGGNSVQDGTPSPENEVPIQNVTGNVEVKVENKNLCNEENLKNVTISGDDIVVATNGATIIEGIFEENTQYAIQAQTKQSTSGTYVRARIVYTDGTGDDILLNSSTDYALKSSVSALNKTINKITSYGGNNFTFKKGTLQIEQNSTATDYIAHAEQTLSFPLAQGQVLHEGDTIEDDGIHQRRFTKELKGNEDWVASTVSEGVYYLTLPQMEKNVTSSLMSHFINYSVETVAEMKKNTFRTIGGTGNSLWIKTEFLTLQDFKNFLAEQYQAGTPVILESLLLEPITIPFTEAQKTAKLQIDKLYSYKGTTHITSTNGPSPTFKIQYVKGDTNESNNND